MISSEIETNMIYCQIVRHKEESMRKLICFMWIAFFAISGIGIANGANYSMTSSGTRGLNIPGGKWWRMPDVKKKLRLSSEEQEKLDGLYLRNQRQVIDFRSTVAKEKLELEDMLDKKTFTESACMNQFDKLQGANKSLAAERFKFLLEVRKLLGFERFQQLKAEFQERRQNILKSKRKQSQKQQSESKRPRKKSE